MIKETLQYVIKNSLKRSKTHKWSM